MTPTLLELHLHDEVATLALGTALAQVIQSHFVASGQAPTIYFSGDLGAGKTTLIRALLRELGVTGRIKSPTYALMEPYEVVLKTPHSRPSSLERSQNLSLYSQLQCYHFDFYRFADTREWLEAGFREYFTPQVLCLVEWPEKAGAELPPADLHLHLAADTAADAGRTAQLQANTPRGFDCLNRAAAFLKTA